MKSRMLVLVAALTLAALGAIAVLSYVSGADTRAIKGKKAVQVLVAKKRIPAGTTGARLRTEALLEQVRMPAQTVPADALGSIDGGLDALVLSGDLQPRQLLLRGMFGRPERSTGGLAIPDGKLAVAVPVTVAAGIAGHVQAGTHVAVFDSFNIMKGKDGVPSGDHLADQHQYNRATRVLLPRIQVLAVGTPKVTDASGAEKPAAASGETLLVTMAANQSEAERLVHGAQTGTLYLALLTDSTDVRQGSGVDNYSLFE